MKHFVLNFCIAFFFFFSFYFLGARVKTFDGHLNCVAAKPRTHDAKDTHASCMGLGRKSLERGGRVR